MGKSFVHSGMPAKAETILRCSMVIGAAIFLAAGCARSTVPTFVAPSTFTPFQPLPAGVESTLPPPGGVPGVESNSPLTGEVSLEAGEAPPAIPPAAYPTPSFSLWLEPSLPAALRAMVRIPPDVEAVGFSEGAMLRLEIGRDRLVSQWVYALVAPFPTISDGVSFAALMGVWNGTGGASTAPLLLTEDTLAVLSALWGAPAPASVKVLTAADLMTYAWRNQPSWGIVPFDLLEPGWKVLAVDGDSPLYKSFDPVNYPLTVPVSLNGDLGLADVILQVYGQSLAPSTNRDPGRMTVLAMTGVTALVRSTAFAMEQQGLKYPAGDIGSLLNEADITHISNEVPFAENCPYPDPFQPGMLFCSNPRYIALMEAVGTDIVELTGDHFQDWGAEAMLYTLGLYKERGWLYFGGGANLEEARSAVTLEHNGNRLAFIGCNAKGGSFAQAGAKSPGATACDFDWMEAEITRLRGEGFLPVVTFQHNEYYTYQAQVDQLRDFRSVARAGAVLVSGSQAHQPQALEFYQGALIHYGLGNLFFDQYEVSLATRQAFIDRHIFYAGRHISTELVAIMFIDYARPRLMTAQERQALLQAVFSASGW